MFTICHGHTERARNVKNGSPAKKKYGSICKHCYFPFGAKAPWGEMTNYSWGNLMACCWQKGERDTLLCPSLPYQACQWNPAQFGPDDLIFEQIQLTVLKNHLLVLFAFNELTQLMKGSDITRATGKDGRCSTCPPSSSIRSAQISWCNST